ncbi:geranylgeranyl diphosphate reductase [Ahrensia sp. R2A130]|uniref:geranylgeranyl diphosphate reductase n=1 Tax=Ahrensia sp. R2A130 TaxID=744979 RepID=UPI0001E08C77|nr:geranylgeranyl diphosphate reductase [Ahrensia sp. R2A130]EFL89100.1 geranylgeranyl hydrogenase [Ahrensia sp. R2A130]
MTGQIERTSILVVGGGPAGATAANDLASRGHDVVLLDRAGRIKPCGGAIPPRAIEDFDIPAEQICARIRSARMIAPSDKGVDMPIENGFVGMVDREHFDEWLRVRATKNGATRVTGTFDGITRNADGTVDVSYKDSGGQSRTITASMVIGADGAKSKVLKTAMPKVKPAPYVFAYHEIVDVPEAINDNAAYMANRCDVYYQGKLSPDFYAWVFPHGKTASIGVGSAKKGFSLRGAVADLRRNTGLDDMPLVRHEGAPIPMKPIKRWDDGKNVIVIGDAAGCVAPASGEGIYYAMACGRMGAEAVELALQTGDAKHLASARKAFLKEHGKVFWVLGILQYFWYGGDRRRERFVKICEDKDVQRLTWESYMHKRLVKREPMAHVRVFFKDMGHLLGLART